MIRRTLLALAATFGVLGLAVCTNAVTPVPADASSAIAKPAAPPASGSTPLVGPLPSLAPLVKQLRPAVVNVYTTQNARPRGLNRNGPEGGQSPFDWFFRGPHQGPGAMKRQALGSGFLIGDGLALTNNHVVEQADEIKVKTSEGREFDAKVVGRDASTDVALLQLQGEGADEMPGVTLGDSEAIEVGDYVVAFGNPFGLSHTVTSGIVSAKERVIGAGPYDNFIQTDASINPGNSGGPLFNLRGEVVGINTAIVAQGQGIGFAVPINLVKELLPQLRESGHVSRGWLGVGIQEMTPELAHSFGVEPGRGVLVAQVFEDGPAAKAGLESGDVVLDFNGRTLSNPGELSRAVASVQPGAVAKLRVIRNGKQRTLDVKLSEREEDDSGTPDVRPRGESQAPSEALVGLTVTPVTPDIARRYDMKAGVGLLVQAVAPDSAADKAGVRPGDVLVDLQRQRLQTLDDFRKATRSVKAGETVLFRVLRGEAALFLTARA